MKNAIVTGASRGIGFGIAEELAKRDYNVMMISRHPMDVVDAINSVTGILRMHAFGCDVSRKEEVARVFEEIYRGFRSIDVLVNNAGINSRTGLNAGNPDDWFKNFERNLSGWSEEIATNLTGAYVCSYLAAGYMLKNGGGCIINISSIKGKEATTSPGYGASKAGVIKLTRDFAKALAGKGIRVNCVAPGFIDTGMTRELSDEKKAAYLKLIPQGRFGDIRDIAKVVAFLASEDSRYITGEVVNVNGGYLMD